MKKRIHNQTSLFGPDYAYLVVLSPPDDIKADIALIKKELNAIADITEKNVHSIAHITLTDRRTDDEALPEIIKELTSGSKPFPIRVQGWDYFDHKNSVTVYLKINNPEPIIKLMISVKSKARTPHISLAKKIPYKTFEVLRPYLEKLEYSAEWTCKEVTVLKKLMSKKELGFKDRVSIPLQ